MVEPATRGRLNRVLRRRRTLDLWTARILGTNISARSVLRGVGLIGATANVLRLHGPSRRDLRDLFGTASPAASSRSCRQISAQTFRIWVIPRIIEKRGSDGIARVTDASNGEEFRAACGDGAVLATWHLGFIDGVSSWLGVVDLEARAFRRHPAYRGRETNPILTYSTESGRVTGIRAAIQELRKKKTVVVAVDGPDGSAPVTIRFFGRSVEFQRGAASLCRLTGVDLLTLVSWWSEEDHAIKTEFARVEWRDIPMGDPDEFDRLLIQRLADWVEDRVRNNPGLLAFQYGRYLASPMWEHQPSDETMLRSSS